MSSLEHYSYYGSPLASASGEESLLTRGRKAAELKDRALDPETGKLLRFHGAFTGGFSSGYYNTVSTKEGWTPSQFFSSKGQRSGNSTQHPEDFMDDEDFSDNGIAPKNFQPKENFSLNNKSVNFFQNDDVTKSLFEKTSLLTFSNTSSIGFDLMRTMGWKDGQGVGPVVLKNKPHMKESKDTMDQNDIPTIDDREESGSESEGEIIEVKTLAGNLAQSDHASSYQSAPRDSESSMLHFKDDKKGIGYTGMRAPNTTESFSNNPQMNNPFQTKSDEITSLFGGTLDSPYEPDATATKREWYQQEVESDDEENTFGWSGGGDGLSLASFEQVGILCCVIPPCRVKIPPNFTPTAVVSNIKGSQVKPYSEHSASERGHILGEKPQPKLQLESSALKFNPLVQSLSSRFVPAQIPDTTAPTDQKPAILQPEKPGLDFPLQTQTTKPLPDKNKEVLEWHPHRILCKRFNVPDPFPSSGVVGIPYRPEKLTFSSLMLSMGDNTAGDDASELGPDKVPWYPTSSDHLPTSDQRPPIDLFTSVFGGDSSSDSEVGEIEGSMETSAKQSPTKFSRDKSSLSESQSSLLVLAQMAAKEVEKKRNLEEKKRKRKSKFVEADEIEGDSLPKFSLARVFGADLPPELLSPRKIQESDEISSREKYSKEESRYKRKDREKDRDRKYSSRHSTSHYDKRHSDHHHYSSSAGYRRK